jgi:hypothetical protein
LCSNNIVPNCNKSMACKLSSIFFLAVCQNCNRISFFVKWVVLSLCVCWLLNECKTKKKKVGFIKTKLLFIPKSGSMHIFCFRGYIK